MSSQVIRIDSRRLIQIPVPVPPNLEAVVGYEREMRFVAFYWLPCRDSIIYDDGHRSDAGKSWGWLAFAKHRIVLTFLRKVRYGNSDTEPLVWLLLDREARTLSYGKPRAVKAVIRRQHPDVPHEPPVNISVKERTEVVSEQEAKIAGRFTRKALLQRKLEDRHNQVEMITWLNDLYHRLNQTG